MLTLCTALLAVSSARSASFRSRSAVLMAAKKVMFRPMPHGAHLARLRWGPEEGYASEPHRAQHSRPDPVCLCRRRRWSRPRG